jgi:hypothetical protein
MRAKPIWLFICPKVRVMRVALVWDLIIIVSLLVGSGSECCAPFPTEPMPHHCTQCLSDSAQVAPSAPIAPNQIVLVQEYIPIEIHVLPNNSYQRPVTLGKNTDSSEPLVNLALRI